MKIKNYWEYPKGQYPVLDDLIGKTLVAVSNIDDRYLIFNTGDKRYALYHEQDCCEQVYIEDICGDLSDLIGSPILVAEERTDTAWNEEEYERTTWTFYTFRTLKGSVDVRWCGTSNGYYSESVDFGEVEEE